MSIVKIRHSFVAGGDAVGWTCNRRSRTRGNDHVGNYPEHIRTKHVERRGSRRPLLQFAADFRRRLGHTGGLGDVQRRGHCEHHDLKRGSGEPQICEVTGAEQASPRELPPRKIYQQTHD